MSQPLHKSICHACCGLWHGLVTQRNLKIHLAAALLAICACVATKATGGETALVLLAIGLVIGLEYLNTAVEAICDLVSPGYSVQIKLAKDLAAGAVLVSALAAVGVALCIFLQPQRLANLAALWQKITG